MTSADPNQGDPRRAELAAAQADLVRCLVGGSPAPPGFDVRRLQATSTALRDKRSRHAARALPHAALHYGDGFRTRFTPWARTHPLNDRGHAAIDGIRFLRSRPRPERWSLPADVVIEWVALELGTRERHASIRRTSHGFVVGLRPVGNHAVVRALVRGRT